MLSESRNRSLFIDHTRVTVRGGRGGNGCCSFRREKYVPFGGPDGGNGGRGGDVIFIAHPHKKSLLDLTYKPHYYAPEGDPGSSSNKVGKSAEDLIVYVPTGTLVYREGKLLADMHEADARLVVAKGGRGGRGNASFKTQRNTAPQISEKGEPGEEFLLDLELKLLADVGLIGCPNAGKSTLLSRLTAARPKIANYPFTTLNPNLGVAEWHGVQMILADIPGLIEGAHEGKGLGHDFLRHVERTRVMFHLVDMSGFDGEDPYKMILMIRKELEAYSPKLLKKPVILIANKMDTTGADERLAALKKKLKKTKIYPISAATGEGLDPLLAFAAQELAKPIAVEPSAEDEEPFRFVVELDFTVERKDSEDGPVFYVKGAKVEKLAAMTNFSQEEGARRFMNILKKMGVEKELLRQGVEPGDTVNVKGLEFFYEIEDEGANPRAKKRYRPSRR